MVLAQEKLAESLASMRQLQTNCDQVKIELANALNMRQGLEKLQEQGEMHVKILKQELDFSE